MNEAEQVPDEEISEPDEQKDPTIARIGSIFLPGFAHIYTEKVGEGMIWTLLVFLTYIFIVGILLHLYLIYNAPNIVEMYNKGRDPLYEDIDDELDTDTGLVA